MKKEKQNYENRTQKITIKHNELPTIVIFESKHGSKEYILKTNTERTKLLLNRKEY